MRWPGELAAAREKTMGDESDLLDRITVRRDVFGGKPIIRDMRVAVEHVLGMLAGRRGGEDPAGVPGTGAREALQERRGASDVDNRKA